jgi:hypothetical protein
MPLAIAYIDFICLGASPDKYAETEERRAPEIYDFDLLIKCNFYAMNVAGYISRRAYYTPPDGDPGVPYIFARQVVIGLRSNH